MTIENRQRRVTSASGRFTVSEYRFIDSATEWTLEPPPNDSRTAVSR
jgi:hypothetical protein